MKKALLLAIDFPPYSSVGRHRIVRFVRHLREFGWEPVVVTRTATYLWDRDPETLKEVPADIAVHRAFYPDFIQIFAAFFSKKGKGRDMRHNRDTGPAEKTARENAFKRLAVRLIRAYTIFKRKYILIPDEYIVWIPFAVYKALMVMRREHIDAIMTVAPPHSLTFAGLLLKKVTKKPWVTDYRDLWTGDHSRMWIHPCRTRTEETMEKFIISRADRIITVSEPKVHVLQKKLPSIASENFHCITNGVEFSDFPRQEPGYKIPDKYTITFTGRLYKKITAEHFFKALSLLLEEKPWLKDKVRVRFFGSITEGENTKLNTYLTTHSLAEVFHHTSYVAHREALKYQAASDLLLLFVGISDNSAGVIPSKLFEYFASGKPILAMAPQGAVWDLINKSKTGICVEPDDINGIKQSLYRFIEPQSDAITAFQPVEKIIRQFDGKALTKKLAQILNNVA